MVSKDERVEFPKLIYVYVCDFADDDVPVFAVGESIDEVETGDVAIYELKTVGQVIEQRKFKAEK